jgi:hypothetical protein
MPGKKMPAKKAAKSLPPFMAKPPVKGGKKMK